MVRAIVGANWGDEGKGKITDMLAKESDTGISTHCHRRQYDPNSKKGIPPSQPVHLSLS